METAAISDIARSAAAEEIWAILNGIARRQKEFDKEMEKTKREWEKEHKKTKLEWEREQKKSKREWDKRMGHLTNRFGELIEHLVAPGMAKRFNELGYHFRVPWTPDSKFFRGIKLS